MIPRSTDGHQRVLCLSYGKDSAACLGALDVLGWPLDRIISAHLWATDEIEADLPEMVDFKAKADEIIYERYGIKVEPVTCRKLYGIEKEKVTYNDIFYRVKEKGKFLETGRAFYGFPTLRGPWCQKLKTEAIRQAIDKDTIQYLGIAADEPKRFHDLNEIKQSPLVAAGWEEERCRKWCEENNLLSPIYTQTLRGGAGSVITKASSNYDFFANSTRTTGRSSYNGTPTAASHSKRTATRCTTTTGGSSSRTKAYSFRVKHSGGPCWMVIYNYDFFEKGESIW